MKIIEYQTKQKVLEENKRGELESTAVKMDELVEVSKMKKEIELKRQDIILKEEENTKEELEYILEKNQKVIDASAIAESSKAKAESIVNIAQADADAIRLRGLARADSKQALANAFEKLDEKSKILFIFEKLPELIDSTLKDDRMAKILGKISEPMGNIDSVKIYDFGGNGQNGNPLQKYSETGPSMLINLVSRMKELGFNNFIEKLGLDSDIHNDEKKDDE